jgi:tRNA threonylcarbamoyladenosine biosynthesis protein TsaE
MREFAGRLPLYHMDLYRLEFNEIDELGLDDYLYGRGVCVIEWAEKGMALIPAEHMLIKLAYSGKSERNIDIIPGGAYYEEMAQHIAIALECAKKDST